MAATKKPAEPKTSKIEAYVLAPMICPECGREMSRHAGFQACKGTDCKLKDIKWQYPKMELDRYED